MLIDFSDILQIDVYELGRTYLRLSQALCINIPAMDPCLYVMRFAHKLEFGEKTHEVSMTALRIVSRMKKDWIHFGRRPSGLCGAALLIASRLHMFNRTVGDVIKIVKVHESTLRKRLNEFGETPASQLTLDEFMTIDLDAMTEEMDPPSFKVARKKDRERLIRLEEEEDLDKELSDLEKQIEKELEDRKKKRKSRKMKGGIDKESQSLQERDEEERFIAESTLETISECVIDNKKRSLDSKLMPPPNSSSTAQHVTKPPVAVSPGIGLKDTIHEYLVDHTAETEKVLANVQALDDDEELDLVGIDENEIDGYIMSDNEIKYKTELWMKVNAEYLKEKAVKEEKERIEAELAEKEGRDPKKRKKSIKKNKVNLGANSTALEAIEKIVQEKKISTKINYDVLKSLNTSFESKHTPKVTLSASSNTGAVVVESVFGEPPLPTPDGISSIFTLGSSSPAKRPRLNTASQSKIKKPSPLLNSISSSHAQEKENSTLPSHLTRLMMLNNNGDSESKSKDVVVESEPVIESGPIQLSTPMHASVAEEEDEDFDEEEEEPEDNHLSVAQLLSQHRGENAHEDFEEEYY
uniref:Transcription factor IIIB 90 kDa subunitlike [Megachile rotundata] n=1 Tax=Lepeophtheirus salmonis TaxID=72036 RepID=A0A0K2UA20_LEPSM